MEHSRKRRYTEEEDAIAAVLRSSVRTGRGFRHYFCGECGGWHMTSWVALPAESNRLPVSAED